MVNDHTKGAIKIISTPSGGKIQLSNSNSTFDITPPTPHTIENLDPGLYTVTVSKGDDSKSEEVNVEAEKTTPVNITILTPEVKETIRNIGYYTVGFIIILAAVAMATYFNFFIPPDNLFKELIFVACSGGLGALAFNMYVYVHHIGREDDFKLEYKYSYYLRPLLGILYGTFVFFFVAGGLMVISGTTTPTGLYDVKSVMFYIALSFIAGYAEEPFSLQLKLLAEALFKEPSDANNKGRTK